MPRGDDRDRRYTVTRKGAAALGRREGEEWEPPPNVDVDKLIEQGVLEED